jgi:eukaryotic-like serine/threonine-protein kinase
MFDRSGTPRFAHRTTNVLNYTLGMSSPTRDYKPGDRVPGTVYAVNRLIGAGGMGTVYDVEDTTIGKRYVLKTLHSQLGDREDLARRMQNEARTLARLHHPNIVEVITAGVTGDEMKLPYYVMERLEGKSLRYVLEKGGQLDLPHAYHIAIDLLDALDHAHDKGVIHRDVKPDNIFLHRTSAGVTVTKLLDFGIMSLLDATQHETAGRFLGTLRYAAPEQLRGEKPTPKVDVYAAGLVLYEMITGRGPFDHDGDPHQVAASHLHKTAPPMSDFVVIPPELDALVGAALSKIPAHRPRDAFSFAASLRNLKKALAGAPTLESTENRATVAAVASGVAPGSAVVHVQHPAPDGPYIISPGSVPPAEVKPAAPSHTTTKGMLPPSITPAVPQPPLTFGPTASTPQSVNREASTHSFTPDPPPPRSPPYQSLLETPGAGRAETRTLRSNEPPSPAPIAFRWPPELPATRSDQPHVQSLRPPQPGAGRPRSRAPVIAGVLLMGALALTSVGLVVRRPRAGTSASQALPAATLAMPSPLPAPQPVVVLPAPSLAPPALEAFPAPGASSPASVASRAPPRIKGAPLVATVMRPVVPVIKASSTAAPPAARPPSTAPVRPGPGF